MKRLLFILSLVSISYLGTACSSDDNSLNTPTEKPDPGKPDPGKEQNQLIGSWQVKKIHFIEFKEKGIPANDACMIEGIRGYEFKEDKTLAIHVGEGSSFDPSAKKYWEWSGDTKSFEIKQLNIAMPPYNFGFKAEKIEIKGEGEGATLSFTASLSNGSRAEFTLEKKSIDSKAASVLTTPDGKVFTCEMFNQPIVKKSDLLEHTWVLEKGQEVFVQEMKDMAAKVAKSDRAKSILVFSFLKEDKSLFKYTFPMGVISAKDDTWVFDDKEKSFKTTYYTNSFGENDLRFTVKLTKISEDKMEFTFTDDEGTNVKRTFVKHTKFLGTAGDLDGFNSTLEAIVEAGKGSKSIK